MKIGVKLFPDLFDLAKSVEEHVDFFELFSLRRMKKETERFSGLEKPIKIIHSEHASQGINPANRKRYDFNVESLTYSQELANKFRSEFIIVHPGVVEGNKTSIDSTVKLLKEFDDKRIITENMPYKGDFNGMIFDMYGTSPESMKKILDATGTGFCLDIGHAWAYAYGAGKDPVEVVKEFLRLKPVMFHFYDGFRDDPNDKHLNFGDGNMDYLYFRSLLPENATLLIESNPDLKKWISDIEIMRGEQ